MEDGAIVEKSVPKDFFVSPRTRSVQGHFWEKF